MVSPVQGRAEHVPPVGGSSQLILIDGRTFAIGDKQGDIGGGAEGYVHADRRHLSRFDVFVDGARLSSLAVATPSPSSSVVVHRLRDELGVERPAIVVRRRRVRGTLQEDVELWATGREPVTVTLSVTVAADFAHIFDVKAGRRRNAATPHPIVDGFEFQDPDGTATTTVRWDRAPDQLDGGIGHVRWVLSAPPGERTAVSIVVSPGSENDQRSSPATGEPVVVRRLPGWGVHAPRVTSPDSRWTEAVDQALADLAALRIPDPDHPERIVVAAGAPWYMTLFGRDSLFTSWMLLPFDHVLVTGVLTTLAELQGSIDDPVAEEEAGKILHEVRATGGEGPFASRARYFGSVDATPLFVATAAEAWRWGALETATLAALAPAIERAVAWIRRHLRGIGLVTYQRRHPQGLANQGWKDSWDGVTFADGSIPSGPIALIEVQGYAYDALRGAAAMATAGLLQLDPADLEHEAARLRSRVNEEFWDPRGWFVLGIDGGGRKIDALTTNPGHALWSGIAEPELASRYLDRIIDADMWTGWGLRTLAATMAAFDPLSYHNGSVWPHDTAICAAGAARYGRWDVVDRISDGILDAIAAQGARPPELFAGIGRDDIPVPVAYPASCSPQAWSAASVLLLVRSVLGLDPEPGAITLRRTDLAALDGLTVRRLRHHGRVESLIVDGTPTTWRCEAED